MKAKYSPFNPRGNLNWKSNNSSRKQRSSVGVSFPGHFWLCRGTPTLTYHNTWRPSSQLATAMSATNSKKLSSPSPTIHQRRLTRQRKLRYLTDKDAGLHSTSSLPASPLPSFKSASSSDHWSSSAVPQPLPRPDSPLTRRHDHHHLGSPPFEHPAFAFHR